MPSPEADIRYVILSDLHMGEAISLLTPFDRGAGTAGEVDMDGPAPALEALCDALGELIGGNSGLDLPTLILNGDVLGMAYASMPEALALFERFVGRMVSGPSPVCSRVVYLPGNHDHHVWEMAREADYSRQVREGGASGEYPEVFHSTSPDVSGGLSLPVLNAALGRSTGPGAEGDVRIVYPNLALLDDAGDRCALIHHGHYAESVYKLMSIARRVLLPETPPLDSVEAIEAENFAWVDFVWSLVGRSGEAGEDLESIFLLLRNKEAFEEVIGPYSDRIAGAVDYPFLPFEWVESRLTKTILNRLSSKAGGERFNAKEACGPETMRGLREYLTGPSLQQIRGARGADPTDLKIIWGHTHKPFVKMAPGSSPPMEVHNLGGWTVDYPDSTPFRGASVALLNSSLDVAHLRLWMESDSGAELVCRVEYPDGGEPHAFGDAVEARVRGESRGAPTAVWQSLGHAVEGEMKTRRRHHRLQRPS